MWFRYHLVISDSDITRYSESVINGYYKMDSLRSNVLITTEYLWHQFIWRGGESLSLKLDWCLWILSAEAISLFINFYSRAWNFRRLVKASSSWMFLAANQNRCLWYIIFQNIYISIAIINHRDPPKQFFYVKSRIRSSQMKVGISIGLYWLQACLLEYKFISLVATLTGPRFLYQIVFWVTKKTKFCCHSNQKLSQS